MGTCINADSWSVCTNSHFASELKAVRINLYEGTHLCGSRYVSGRLYYFCFSVKRYSLVNGNKLRNSTAGLDGQLLSALIRREKQKNSIADWTLFRKVRKVFPAIVRCSTGSPTWYSVVRLLNNPFNTIKHTPPPSLILNINNNQILPLTYFSVAKGASPYLFYFVDSLLWSCHIMVLPVGRSK